VRPLLARPNRQEPLYPSLKQPAKAQAAGVSVRLLKGDLTRLEPRPHVHNFRHDPALIERNDVKPEAGAGDAYVHLAPMIDTAADVDWLLHQVVAVGCDCRRDHGHGSPHPSPAASGNPGDHGPGDQGRPTPTP
jgi:hypothetical protein